MFHVEDSGDIFLAPEEFFWKVDIDQVKSVGDSISSPKFVLNQDFNFNQWSIQIYPKGETDEYKDYVSLYLRYHGSTEVEISYTFSFVNWHGKRIVIRKDADLFEPGDYWGFMKVFSQKDLKDLKNNFLKDGILCISCMIETDSNIILSNENVKQINNFEKPASFEKLLNDKEFSDVTLVAGGETFYAHKCILSNSSPVFRAMFLQKMKEGIENKVEIHDISSTVLEELIRFIYTDKVNNIEKKVCELLTAAEKYNVDGLKTLCEKTMCEIINNKNALEFLCSADLHNAQEVKIKAIEWISTNLEIFLKKSKFKAFGESNPELVYKIIQKRMNINTSDEGEEDSEEESEPQRKKKKM